MLITYLRVKELAESHGSNIAKLQEELDLGNAAIYKWQDNDVTPNSDTLRKIGDFYSVSVDYLLGRVDNPNFFAKDTTYQVAEVLEEIDLTCAETDFIKEFIILYHQKHGMV